MPPNTKKYNSPSLILTIVVKVCEIENICNNNNNNNDNNKHNALNISWIDISHNLIYCGSLLDQYFSTYFTGMVPKKSP